MPHRRGQNLGGWTNQYGQVTGAQAAGSQSNILLYTAPGTIGVLAQVLTLELSGYDSTNSFLLRYAITVLPQGSAAPSLDSNNSGQEYFWLQGIIAHFAGQRPIEEDIRIRTKRRVLPGGQIYLNLKFVGAASANFNLGWNADFYVRSN